MIIQANTDKASELWNVLASLGFKKVGCGEIRMEKDDLIVRFLYEFDQTWIVGFYRRGKSGIHLEVNFEEFVESFGDKEQAEVLFNLNIFS